MSITHFSANAAQRRLTAVLVGTVISESIPTGTKTVGYRLTTAGNEQSSLDGTTWTTIGVWLPAGAVSTDYDVIYNVTGDTTFMGGALINSWISMSGTRVWTIEASAPALPVSHTCTGTVQLRMAAPPNTILATATVTMTAAIDP
jgi:hypothetical protein